MHSFFCINCRIVVNTGSVGAPAVSEAHPDNQAVPAIMDPIDPSIPVDQNAAHTPTDLVIPVDPAAPIDPGSIVDLVAQTSPEAPVNAVGSADPINPVQPSTPAEPAANFNEVVMVDPLIPHNHVVSGDPGEPIEPVQTIGPVVPMVSSAPIDPAVLVEPSVQVEPVDQVKQGTSLNGTVITASVEPASLNPTTVANQSDVANPLPVPATAEDSAAFAVNGSRMFYVVSNMFKRLPIDLNAVIPHSHPHPDEALNIDLAASSTPPMQSDPAVSADPVSSTGAQIETSVSGSNLSHVAQNQSTLNSSTDPLPGSLVELMLSPLTLTDLPLSTPENVSALSVEPIIQAAPVVDAATLMERTVSTQLSTNQTSFISADENSTLSLQQSIITDTQNMTEPSQTQVFTDTLLENILTANESTSNITHDSGNIASIAVNFSLSPSPLTLEVEGNSTIATDENGTDTQSIQMTSTQSQSTVGSPNVSTLLEPLSAINHNATAAQNESNVPTDLELITSTASLLLDPGVEAGPGLASETVTVAAEPQFYIMNGCNKLGENFNPVHGSYPLAIFWFYCTNLTKK